MPFPKELSCGRREGTAGLPLLPEMLCRLMRKELGKNRMCCCPGPGLRVTGVEGQGQSEINLPVFSQKQLLPLVLVLPALQAAGDRQGPSWGWWLRALGLEWSWCLLGKKSFRQWLCRPPGRRTEGGKAAAPRPEETCPILSSK